MSVALPVKVSAWGRLLRLPNLFSVPGDVLVGAAWAGAALVSLQTGYAILAVLLIYCAGLLLNDFFDWRIDAIERPNRPIPSGQVSPTAVLTVGIIAICIGVFTAFAGCGIGAGAAALVTSCLVIGYDAGGKKVPVLGPILMGLCRGGAVSVGIFAIAGSAPVTVFFAAAVTTLYIVSVTIITARETEEYQRGFILYVPGIIIVLGAAAAVLLRKPSGYSWLSLLFFAGALQYVIGSARNVQKKKLPVPPFIGRLLKTHIVIQGGWIILVYPELGLISVLYISGLFIALRMGGGFLSRFFYSS